MTAYNWLKILSVRQSKNNFDISDVPKKVLQVLKACRCIAGPGVITMEGTNLVMSLKKLLS